PRARGAARRTRLDPTTPRGHSEIAAGARGRVGFAVESLRIFEACVRVVALDVELLLDLGEVLRVLRLRVGDLLVDPGLLALAEEIRDGVDRLHRRSRVGATDL